mgnify:CR=1 FL=1
MVFLFRLQKEDTKVHSMVQDTIDLYAQSYDNGQIFAVTENIEKNIDIVFNSLDKIRESNCKKKDRL